jgi:hypothetical protein
MITADGLYDIAIRIENFDDDWHLTDGMGGAGEAGIMSANGCLDPIQHTFLDIRSMDISFGDAIDCVTH